MYWPWQQRALTRNNGFQGDTDIENYINHATADGASWDEDTRYSNENRIDVDKEENPT